MRGASTVAERLGVPNVIRLVHIYICLNLVVRMAKRAQTCRTCKPSLHEVTCRMSPAATPAIAAPAPHSSDPEQWKHHQYVGARLIFSTYLQLLK